jgi:alpha-L-rhamnosidase
MKAFFAAALLALGLVLSCGRQETRIDHLKCEYQSHPVGLDVLQPRLSWQIQSEQRAISQSGYRILVASTLEKLQHNEGDLWDSGQVHSNQSAHIPYSGAPLQSRQKVHWKVMIWDQDQKPVRWSAAESWEMALLQASDWQAKWIGRDESQDRSEPPAPLLRKAFSLSSSIKQARLYISGLGYYEASLNGCRIGDHVHAPHHTNYDRRLSEAIGDYPHGQMGQTVFYETYDVSDALKPGDNVLGVILGNGWYRQQDNLADKQIQYDSPRLLAQLEVVYSNGEKQIIATDETWKTGKSPILHNGIYSGETYDARLEMPGWDQPGFKDADWPNAVVVRTPVGELHSQTYPPDRIIKVLPSRAMTVPDSGIYQFDMGQMISGWARLTISGPAGSVVTLRFIEELGPTYGQIDKYILKEGKNIWEPRFTWHAFRYVQVQNPPQPLTIDAVQGCVVNTDVDSAGSFECSNPLFNKIIDNYRWTQLGNMHGGVPSDCPHRERRGYTGDGQISARAAIYSFDMSLFYTKWLNDIRDAQDHNTGHVPNVAPYEGGGGGTAWGSAAVLLPWYMYLYYGDTRILHDYYDMMQHWTAYMTSQLDGKGLLANQGLGEWVPPDITAIPETYVNTCYYFHNLDIMSRIAALLGHTDDAKKYKAAMEQTRDVIHHHYLNSDRSSYSIGWQGADVFPLGFHITPDSLEAAVLGHLTNHMYTRCQGHFDTGILATPLLLELLSEHDQNELAYTLMNQRDYPSYGYMIEKGATTIWETWLGDQSHSHPMFGSVCQWFYDALAGISPDPDHPGFKHVLMQPHLVAGLDHVNASYPSPFGLIKSQWHFVHDDFVWDITLPANSSATVSLPASVQGQITESGKKPETRPGVRFSSNKSGRAVFEIASGHYSFRSSLVRSSLPTPVLPAPTISPADTLVEMPNKAFVKIQQIMSGQRPLQVRFTLDGSEPDSTSILYNGPFTVDHTVVVKAKLFQDGHTAGLTASQIVQFVDPHHNGLQFKRYNGLRKKLPDFGKLKPERTGKLYYFSLEKIVGKDDLFAAEFYGQIKIDRPGRYTFYVLSNDGSKLFLDGKLVVDNDGQHGAEERSGSIQLTAGLHDYRLAYFQAGGGMLLKVSYAGPEIGKQEIAADRLYVAP